MKEIKNRLVYLFTGECVAAVTFTILYFYYFSFGHPYSLMYVLLVLDLILLQGSLYWFVKWKRVKDRRKGFSNLYKFFAGMKIINMVLICIAPLIFILEMTVLKGTTFPVFLLGVFILVFTIIEYINYFHIQLTNYKNGRGKKSSIAKGIEKSKM